MILQQTEQLSSTTKTYSVTELNRRVKDLLEIHFSLIWIEGEISNLSRPASGHWYFTLKDDGGQIRCAMFRGRNTRVAFEPSNGDQVKLRAKVSLYEGRGDYQLIVEHMEQAGFGLLQKRYEETKRKLHNEGLFDDAHKRVLPVFPKHVAIVTSPSGAAIQDILSVFARRFPNLLITLFPCSVQGDNAPDELINKVNDAQDYDGVELILLTRGGGSIEDLWAFNNENLARTIRASSVPVVSAVGHEIDFTIADFAADLRAPTPSAAAEIICPDKDEVYANFEYYKEKLNQQMQRIIETEKTHINTLSLKMKHPLDKIYQWMQRVDLIEKSLVAQITFCFEKQTSNASSLAHRLLRLNPKDNIQIHHKDINQLRERLVRHVAYTLEAKQRKFQYLTQALNTLSPLATVARGYSIIKNRENNLVTSIEQVKEEDEITIELSDGSLKSRILKVLNSDK